MRNPSTPFELSQLLKAAGERGVIVQFTSENCPPCRRFQPVFAGLEKEFPQALFASVDVDECGEIAEEHAITATPTFKTFSRGHEVGTVRGGAEAEIRRLLGEHAGDKWEAAGHGHRLGGAAASDDKSVVEKRLSALERRSSGEPAEVEAEAEATGAGPAPKSLEPGATARIQGLRSRPDLNGQPMVVHHWDERSGRWAGRVVGGDAETVMLLPANLVAG